MELRTRARRIRGAGIVAVALLLIACGGGGSGGGNSPPPTPPTPPPPPPPTVTLTIDRTSILEGESVQVTWSSTGATSCTAAVVVGIAVTGWDGQIPTSGTRTVGPLDRLTEFALNCSSGAGVPASVIKGVLVTPSPPALTLQVTPGIVREGQTAQLTWTGNRLIACEAQRNWSGPRPTAGSETIGPFIQNSSLSYELSCTTARGDTISDDVSVDARLGTNQPPVANAGPDRTADSAHRVELQGGFSTDDHQIVSYFWTQVGGPAVSLGPGNSPAFASFTAPIVTANTVLTFALTVTDDEGLTSTPDTMNLTLLPIPPSVPISGGVRYERVAHGFLAGTGLDYASQGFESLSNVRVDVLNAATQNVIASGSFPTDFHFDVPSQTDLRLRATAVVSRQAPTPLPHWQISVRDLDDDGAPLGDVYSYTGPVFNSGAGSVAGGPHALDIPSGWNAAGQLVGPRHAAPFAILGSIRFALEDLTHTFPQPDLPSLIVDWSPTNPGGQTFFQPNPGGTARIVLAGEQDVDTDEYDRSVILHEFGHFVMHSVSRDDSPGGPHALGERVDMRLALSEGFATAFAAYMTHDAEYRDSFGPGQGNSGFFHLDFDFPLAEGWFSESSVQEVMWRMQDFDRFWQVLNGPLREGDALTSPFALFAAFREIASSQSTLDLFLQDEEIVGPTIDAYGSTETNGAGAPNINTVLPVYTAISIGGSVQLMSTNQFGTGSKLSTHRFLRLNVPVTTNLRFRASAAVAGKDPDLLVFHRGVSMGPDPGPANEDFSLVLEPGEYILDVFECGNAGCNPSVTPGPVNITVSVTAS